MNFNNYNYNNFSFKAKPIPKNILEKTKLELLDKDVKNVDIYCHTSADEDTINSAKVFSSWLKANGKNSNICVAESEINDLYIKPKDLNIKKNSELPDKTIILDFNSAERIAPQYKKIFDSNDSKNILGYDHHEPGENLLKGDIYIDSSAKSCCSVLTRFFEGLGVKLPIKDKKSLYCGMISDYKKSGLVNIKNDNGIYSLEKKSKLLQDKNSLEVFESLDKAIPEKDKKKIYKHLDPLSRLTADEKKLREKLFNNIQVSPNGKMAYVVIPPNDKLWAKLGMDNLKTSTILKDLRSSVSSDVQNVKFLSDEQKNKLKDVDTVVTFYRKADIYQDEYRMSIHSKSNSALNLINYVKDNSTHPVTAGGHADRAGGKIDSIEPDNVKEFVKLFVDASNLL